MRAIAHLILFIALFGCASYDGSGLKPGISTTADVVQLMGTPAMRWSEPGGGELLAFPRGPSGTATFMVRIAANGTLASKENVLDMRHFAQIQAGMTEQEVLRASSVPRSRGGRPPTRRAANWSGSGGIAASTAKHPGSA